jgi:L-malate glycosyltransferase
MIRVFHLIKSLGRGGAEMLLPESLRFADRQSFSYSYGYFLPWKDAMVPALRSQSVDVTCFGGRSNLQILLQARRLAEYLKKQKIDVLHCHLPVAGAVGRIAGRLAGVPVVYSEHNKQERYHVVTRKLNRATWKWQARAVAVSSDVAESIRAWIGSEVPVEVILNGVDTGRFSRDGVDPRPVLARYGIPQGAPVVGTVAVFRVQKRLQDWLEAARLVHERFPDVRFLLVGDGPLRDEVRETIATKRLEGIVHLPGLQEDVRPYLAATDIYMMSSIFEGLPVALLEAMSMGCAPVCTAVGGIPEAITSGRNGLLTEAEQPEKLAEAVCALVADSGKRRLIAEAARQTVHEHFSMERMTRQLEELYLSVHQGRQNGH